MTNWKPSAGDALLIPTGPGTIHHLHIVLNDPKVLPGYGQVPRVGLANFSSVPPNGLPYDKTCCFSSGVHPFITHESYIRYVDMRLEPVTDLCAHVATNFFILHAVRLSFADVQRIKDGIDYSPRTKGAYKKLGL